MSEKKKPDALAEIEAELAWIAGAGLGHSMLKMSERAKRCLSLLPRLRAVVKQGLAAEKVAQATARGMVRFKCPKCKERGVWRVGGPNFEDQMRCNGCGETWTPYEIESEVYAALSEWRAERGKDGGA